MPFRDWRTAALACMAEGVVFQDATGHIENCNEAAERILGLTRDQMNGLTSTDPHWRTVHEDGTAFPGDDHPAMVTLRTGEAQSNVIMGVHKPDGSLVWISINSRLVVAPGEPPTGVVTTFNDITEMRRIQNLLRLSEEQLAKGFMSSATIGTISKIEADGAVRLIRVNEAFERQTGYRALEAIGRTVQELELWEDRGAQAAAVNDFRMHGEIRNLRMRFRRKDGKIRDGLLSVTTAEFAGRILALTSITDVTEEKRQAEELEKAVFDLSMAERRYRQMFNAVSVAVIVSHLEPTAGGSGVMERIIDANDRACMLSEYTRDELLQMKGADLNAPGHAPDVPAALRSLQESGSSRRLGMLQTKSGKQIPVEVHASYFELDSSQRLITSVRDLSETVLSMKQGA